MTPMWCRAGAEVLAKDADPDGDVLTGQDGSQAKHEERRHPVGRFLYLHGELENERDR